MAENELNIKVTTDVNSINALETNIKKIRSEFKNATIGSEEFNKAALSLKTTLEAKSKAMSAASTENAKMMKSYFTLGEEIRSKTLPIMTSFNQIIQDAPFGIRGVGNNIQFLTQQFTQLRASGMSTKDIISGMVKNAFTPMGGLMLAVSSGTSLLTVVMDKLGSSAGKSEGEIKKLNDELLRFNVELGNVSSQRHVDILTKDLTNLKQKLDEKIAEGSFGRMFSAGIYAWTGGKFGSITSGAVGAADAFAGLRNAEIARNKAVFDYIKSKREELQIVGKSTELNDSALATLRNIYIEQRNIVIGAAAQREIDLELLRIDERRKKIKDDGSKAAKKIPSDYWKDPYGTDFYKPTTLAGEKGFMNIGGAPVAPPGMIEKLFAAERQGAAEQAEWDRLAAEYARRRKHEAEEQQRAKDEAIRQWQQENELAMVAISSIGAGLRSLGQSILGTTRQAVDAWDAAWLAMQNTAVNALSNIASSFVEKGIMSLLMSLFPGGGAASAVMSNWIGPTGPLGFASGGWIPEPVYGIGASGRRYTFGERGAEYVVPNHAIGSLMNERQSGERGGSVRPSVQVVPIVNNQGLAVQVRIGEQQRVKRTR